MKTANCPNCYDGGIYKSKYNGYRCYACGKEVLMEEEQ